MLLLDVSRLIWRRWIGRTPTGIDRVCLAYVHRLGPQALAVVQGRGQRIVLDRSASRQLFALLQDPGDRFRAALARAAAGWPVNRAGRRDIQGQLYLNLGHTGLDDPGLVRWIADLRLKAVFFVHDLIPLVNPEYCRAGEASRHARRMDIVLASAAGVIGNSQETLDALATFARQRGAPLPAMIPALLGSDFIERHVSSPAALDPPRGPTFIMLGTIEGRKNHLFLLQLWSRLSTRLGACTPKLLIVGQRGWECEQALAFLDRAPSLKDHVVELSDCGDDEVGGLLGSARALLFPSLAEGYGLPLVEALRLGTPVIASDLAVFREIGGDVPDYLDPLDGPAWTAAILDYADEPSARRSAQLERLKRYRAPTWDDHFRAVEPWLEGLVG